MKADLHMHSTASDGVCAPDALMARAAQAGLTHVALTDHDSMAGIPAAREAAERLGIVLIPGVELSCGASREIHVLGYGMDEGDAALGAFCARRVTQREARAEAMAARLEELGMPIRMDRVRALAGGAIARPHIARAMVEAGYVFTVAEAFDRYLKPGKPVYVPKEDVKVAHAVKLIEGAGGVAVLAHPMELGLGETALISLVSEWQAQGLAGIEVYHPSAQNNHAAFLHRMANRMGLLVTGGSDFHGEAVRRTQLGEGLARWTTAEQDVQALRSRIRR